MTTRTSFAWVALAFAGIAGAALPAPAQTPPVVSDTEPRSTSRIPLPGR